jgi:hypothetical protein
MRAGRYKVGWIGGNKCWGAVLGIMMEEDAEEPEFIDRKNVIEIWNIDGNYTGRNKRTKLVSDVTGDEYKGEWEIL